MSHLINLCLFLNIRWSAVPALASIVFGAGIFVELVSGLNQHEGARVLNRLGVVLWIFDRDFPTQVIIVGPRHAYRGVQLVAEWMFCSVEPGFAVETRSLDDQRVAVPMSDRCSPP